MTIASAVELFLILCQVVDMHAEEEQVLDVMKVLDLLEVLLRQDRLCWGLSIFPNLLFGAWAGINLNSVWEIWLLSVGLVGRMSRSIPYIQSINLA